MRPKSKTGFLLAYVFWISIACVEVSFAAGSARNGQGNMTVTPNVVNTGSVSNYFFRFRAQKNAFITNSQATLLIPSGWSAPQTNNASGIGFIKITPVMSGSTASLNSVTGSGPWLLTIDFSANQNQGGFSVDYNNVTAPTNGGLYQFTAQSRQSSGTFRQLKSGSPVVTVNSLTKTNTSTVVISSLSPSTYGQNVTFTATVTGAGPGNLAGTVAFRDGDVVLGTVPLDAQGKASFTTNRFSVPDAPSSITAEYSGNSVFNPSLSPVLLQDVNPAAVTVSGLLASNKTYDGNSAATLNTSNATLSGVLAGDDVSVDPTQSTASFADPNAGTNKSVTVTGLALSGLDGGNYVPNPVSSLTATIFPAPLTVTANDTNRFFGATNPVFTASYSGFVGTDDVGVLAGTPAFSTTALPTSPVAGNPYPIVVSKGTLSANNYVFSFVPGKLTIDPLPLHPQRIVSITRFSDGHVGLVCEGAAGQPYVVQAAASLPAGSWINLLTNTTDINGTMSVVDSQATNVLNRFYRTSLP